MIFTKQARNLTRTAVLLILAAAYGQAGVISDLVTATAGLTFSKDKTATLPAGSLISSGSAAPYAFPSPAFDSSMASNNATRTNTGALAMGTTPEPSTYFLVLFGVVLYGLYRLRLRLRARKA